MTLGDRLAASVARKLDAPVTFVGWVRQPTGDVPVFGVPPRVATRALRLGLTVNTVDETNQKGETS